MTVQMLTSHSALQHLGSENFRARWIALYDSCPWATACQHPDFVLPWYALYGAAFLPVIVFDERDDGTLAGLLTLALRPHGKTLTGAGDQQAEYQGWIQASGAGGGFMPHALRALRAQFPGADLRLKYLPPGIPLNWTEEKEGAGGLCAVRTHARPLMQIDAAGMSRQRNKKNHRQNYNRLKRLGEVQLESVVEHDHFLGMFDEISLQYDFRQAAFFRNMPFSRDPLKKPFYIELQKRGLLHTTVLTVGDQVAASHIGLFSQGRAIHLGINTYDPAFAAHSPGNLLLAMLGVHLVAEGVPLLDLTPGGDKYKEQFATGHDVVSELIVYPDRASRLIGETLLGAVRFSKARLRAAGVRPAEVVAAFQKMKDFTVFGKKLRPKTNGQVCELRYRPGALPVVNTRLPIARNSLQDMVKFDAQGSFARYCDFLGTVMKRLERSIDLFTLVQDGRLAMFCWVRSVTAEARNHIVLFDLYVHPDFEKGDLIRNFIAQLVLELRGTAHDTDISYRGALNGELQTVLKQGGFADAEGGAAPVGAGVLNCVEF
jgi:CelD/BcsL family acetyltransferase involved in cellulose biosynthesis